MKVTSFTLLLYLIGLTAYAQESDSLQHKQETDSASVTQPSVPGQQSPTLDERIGFTEDNTERIEIAEVPPVLRKVLQNEEYRGWENGAVYRNITTHEYKVEIQQPPYVKTFYFDKKGTRILE